MTPNMTFYPLLPDLEMTCDKCKGTGEEFSTENIGVICGKCRGLKTIPTPMGSQIISFMRLLPVWQDRRQ